MDYYLIFQYFIYFVAKIFAIFIHIQTVLVTNLNRGNHEYVNKWTRWATGLWTFIDGDSEMSCETSWSGEMGIGF